MRRHRPDDAGPQPPGARPRRRSRDPLVGEHKAAFAAYVRSGEAGGLKRLEAKALSAGSGPDGGYLAPSSVESEILRRLSTASPIRALATVRTISSGTYKKAFSTTGPASGWVGETAARPQTGSPTLAELSFPAMELYAMPAATQTLLDDAIVNIDQWIAEEVESAFAEQEGAAFVSGDGIDKPKGFLAYPMVAEASWNWGSIGVLNTGVAGAFATANPSDILVDLVYALKAGYRQNASFVMNRKTQGACASSRTRPASISGSRRPRSGAPATLMGFPLVEAETCPTSPTTRSRSPSATSGAAISSSTGRACASCAIPIRPSPMCCSTRPSASAAACRTSRRSRG
jgi:HK97 family phage major capsid protein